MLRTAITAAALAAFIALAPCASAQRPLPLSPGVTPASPFGPGMPYAARPLTQRAGTASAVYFPMALPWGWGLGWGYQTYNPWIGYGYSYGGIVPPDFATPFPVIAEPQMRPEPAVVLANEFPATLSIQFPTAAEVWLDGKKVSGTSTDERVLTSPVLQPNQTYTFLVKAQWTKDGKTYEAKRAVTLGAGDRSRLLIVSGDEVRE